jgi:hypothetical protein
VQAPQADETGSVIGDAALDLLLSRGASKPLGGAFVILRPATSPLGLPGRLQPGLVYATSDPDGEYLMVAPAASEAYILTATHPRFQERLQEPVIGIFDLGPCGRRCSNISSSLSARHPITAAREHRAHAARARARSGMRSANQRRARTLTPPNIFVSIQSVAGLAEGVQARLQDVTLLPVSEEVLENKRKRWIRKGSKRTKCGQPSTFACWGRRLEQQVSTIRTQYYYPNPLRRNRCAVFLAR